jgi:hypothetical protein
LWTLHAFGEWVKTGRLSWPDTWHTALGQEGN